MKIRIVLKHFLVRKIFEREFTNIFEAKDACTELLLDIGGDEKDFAWDTEISYSNAKNDFVIFERV